jgi:hypothetical protein
MWQQRKYANGTSVLVLIYKETRGVMTQIMHCLNNTTREELIKSSACRRGNSVLPNPLLIHTANLVTAHYRNEKHPLKTTHADYMILFASNCCVKEKNKEH